MAPISTFVFLDLETSGLPNLEHNKTRVTEISLIAVKTKHLLDTKAGETPRVQQKVTLCLNPQRLILPDSSEISGLCNFLLEHEPNFNNDVFTIINTFFSLLTKPVCLVAHNGLKFDFPILKNHLEKINVTLDEDLLCSDSLDAFQSILSEKEEITPKSLEEIFSEPFEIKPEDFDMQKVNETTPKSQQIGASNDLHRPNKKKCVRQLNTKAKRNLFGGQKVSLKLCDIYENILNTKAIDCHRAESDTLILLKCAVAVSQKFIEWTENNNYLFSNIKAMEVGVPLYK